MNITTKLSNPFQMTIYVWIYENGVEKIKLAP